MYDVHYDLTVELALSERRGLSGNHLKEYPAAE